jgi:hypothetical protein
MIKIKKLQELHQQRTTLEQGLEVVNVAIQAMLDDLKDDIDEEGFTCDQFSLRSGWKYDFKLKDKKTAEENGMFKPRYYLDTTKLKDLFEVSGAKNGTVLGGVVVSRDKKVTLYTKNKKGEEGSAD